MNATATETKTFRIRIWRASHHTSEDHWCIWRWLWSVTNDDTGEIFPCASGCDTKWGARLAARSLAKDLAKGPEEERWTATFERVDR